ncbi:MAG: GH32 C-terminal domain-containing protein, partial [Pirellulaceae bacterium]
REVETLRDRGRHWEDIYLGARDNPFRGLEGELFELRVALEPDEHVDEIIFAFRDESMRYDPKQRRLHFRGQSIPAGDAGGALKLQILIDRTSLEVFADEGRTSMSFYLAPNPRAAPLAMTVLGGHATISRMDLWRLKSIWARQFSTAGP